MGLTVVAVVLGFFLKLHSLYFGLISLFAIRKRKRYPSAKPKTRFAVVIAARNEAAVIGRLIDSLMGQAYPTEFFDVYVAANNCTDDTAAAALSHGAKLLTCEGRITCKGDALRQALDQLMDKPYDAFCVFDADNVADPRFLMEMNAAFEAGAQIAKGRNEALNPCDSWVAGCYGIYFGFFNLLYNRARAACGLSAKLVGTGFAVSRKFLLRMGGWNTGTLAEDAEFAAQCARAGERVYWVPDAVAYDEEPNSFALSLIQRRRWCSGSMQVAERYLAPVAASVTKVGGRLAMDSVMFLLSPFVQVLSAFTMLLAGILALPGGGNEWMVMMGFALSYAGTTLGAAGIVWLSGRWDRRMLKAILMFGVFMASWLPLQVIALFRKTVEWKAIAHGETVKATRVPMERPRQTAV